MLCIVLNTASMAMEHDSQSCSFGESLAYVDLTFTIIYTFEAIFKIAGMGFGNYWKRYWNKFDFLVVIVSWLDSQSRVLSNCGRPDSTGDTAVLFNIIGTLRIGRYFGFSYAC